MDYHQLLARLLSDSILENETVSPLKALPKEDWETFLVYSDQHHVTSILYPYFISTEEKNNIPETALEQMSQVYLSNVARNTRIFHETGVIFRRFSQAGIKAIGLKGLFLIENVYHDFGMRTMSDMDILIRKADIPEAILILGELGYQPTTYFDIKDQNIDIKHVPPFFKGETNYVEIHWTILEENEPFNIDAKGLWDRALPAKIAEEHSLGMCLEDLILHLCIHLTYQHHLQLGLRGLYDIALVLKQSQNDLDWKTIVDRSNEWRAQKVIALTFQLLAWAFDIEIPEEVSKGLLTKPIPLDLLDQAKQQVLLKQDNSHNLTPDLVNLSEVKGIYRKIKVILSRVFLPKQVIARIYNVSPKSLTIYMYYPVRLWDLWRNYRESVRKMMREDQEILDKVTQTQAKSQLREWFSSEIT